MSRRRQKHKHMKRPRAWHHTAPRGVRPGYAPSTFAFLRIQQRIDKAIARDDQEDPR